MKIDRRGILGAALGALAGAAGRSGAAVAAASSVAAAPPARPSPDPVMLYRKLHLRTDDGLLFWWLQGPKIGQVGTTLTPLYNSSIGTLQRIRHHADGGFELTQLELIILADLETGQPLRDWRNPYTGETLPVTFTPVGPSTTQYRADNSRVLPSTFGGARLEATTTIHPPLIVGDDVFIRDESSARVYISGRTLPFEVNDSATYHGSLANLTDPTVKVGEATVAFADVSGWQRWMNMGERPGSLTSRLSGRKRRRYEELPSAWRAQLAALAPRIAADPVAALDAPPAKFER